MGEHAATGGARQNRFAPGPPRRTLIVLIHIAHPNDLESARSSRRTLAEYGYTLEEISVTDPHAADKLAALLRDRAHEIFFFMSANLYALNIRSAGRLLHEFTGIPLVIMMHDHPLYFVSQLGPELNGTIAFVPGEDSRDFVEKHYPISTLAVTNSGSLPAIESEEPALSQFLGRENAILAPMNLALGGLTLDTAWQSIRHLPSSRRAQAIALTELALADCLTPLHILATRLPEITGKEAEQLPLQDQLLVLNYVKLARRDRMVRALIDLPLLVSSDYVPGDLQLKYPEKFVSLSMAETLPLYSKYRFTLNAHPLLGYIMHDRVINALFGNSVSISDVNAAIVQHFHDEQEMIFFDYANPDMPAKVAKYVDDPELAFKLTVRSHAALPRTTSLFHSSYQTLIDAVNRQWGSKEHASVHSSG